MYSLSKQIRKLSPHSDNAIRVHHSTDEGATWDTTGYTITTFDNHPDGYSWPSDFGLFNMHILADPATSNVWAFYVEFDNRLCGDPAGQQKVSILNCRRSVNNGHDWSVPVQNIPGSVYSTLACGPENFAKLPDEQDDYVLDGFFRIGRVWSCLDSAGRIHVVWMDNREGVHPDPLTYPHRDFWRVYRSVSSDGGLTWSSVVLPVSTASSLGGFGNPHPGSFYPPGDHLGCCADDQYLYVTWPDARHYAEMAPDQAGRIYVRRFNLTP